MHISLTYAFSIFRQEWDRHQQLQHQRHLSMGTGGSNFSGTSWVSNGGFHVFGGTPKVENVPKKSGRTPIFLMESLNITQYHSSTNGLVEGKIDTGNQSDFSH